MITERSVLNTLRRVPDRIILAVMGRDLDLEQGDACLCGWFVREKLAEMQNVGASTVALCDDDHWRENIPEIAGGRDRWGQTERNTAIGCAKLFGGTARTWNRIYNGVTYTGDPVFAVIERAFVRRVDEAVKPKRARKAGAL